MNSSRVHLERFVRAAAASVPPGSLVLDAGAGDGAYRPLMAAHRYESADFAQVDKPYADDITYVCDLAAIPVEDDRFDLVLMTQVLEHLREPAAVLAELRRVLRPGGRLWLTTPLFYEEHEVPYDFFRYTRYGLEHLVGQAGFADIAVHWLEGYLGTVSYELDVAARAIGEDGWRGRVAGVLQAAATGAAHLDVRRRITSVGHPKNYALTAVVPPDPVVALAGQVVERRLTYLSPAALDGLRRCVVAADRDGVPGSVLEAGVALGGSALVLAAAAGASGRRFDGFDVFGPPPPPTEQDGPDVLARHAVIASGRSEGIGGDLYYGYREELLAEVVGRFAAFGMPVGDRVRLHRGLFEDVLHPDGPVAVAHIDCDRYEAVATCLTRIAPHVPPGGFLVIDDYAAFSGARRAVDDHLERDRRWARVPAEAEHLVLRRGG